MRVRDRPLLSRILKRHRLYEHVPKHQLHGDADFRERKHVPERAEEALLLVRGFDGRSAHRGIRSGSATAIFSIETCVSLKLGTPVWGSMRQSIKSLTGGSLKCSGKKQVPTARLAFSCVRISSDPRAEVIRTASFSPTCKRARSSGCI